MNLKYITKTEQYFYSYTRSVQEDSFNGEVLQYVKGKVSNKAVIKDNKLVSGKIRIDEDARDVEIERKGEWIIIRQYTKAGKLFSEEKILINEKSLRRIFIIFK